MGKIMKKYFGKPHRAAAFLMYLYAGLITFFDFLRSGPPDPLKIAAAVVYGAITVFAVVFLIKGNKLGVKDIVPPLEKDKGGIVDVQVREKKKYEDIRVQFNKATSSIKIISYYGDNLLAGTKEEIINAMGRNVKVQMLIAKGGSCLLNEVWDLEGGRQNARVERTREMIAEIRKEAKEKAVEFTYKEYNTQTRYALTAVDGKWAWWTPYHPGIRVEKTSSIILTDNGGESIIRDCLWHFEKLWDKLPGAPAAGALSGN